MSPITVRNGEMMRRGRIEVICGSMFSGKTEELIRRLKRAEFARQSVEIFKPSIDTRYAEQDVVSHEGNSIPSTPVDSSASILLLGSDTDVVGIDEAQFFDENLIDVCNELANRGTRVIVAGLDLDFKGVPFGGRSDQGARHLCALRCAGLRVPPYGRRRETSAFRGTNSIRAALPCLLPKSDRKR